MFGTLHENVTESKALVAAKAFSHATAGLVGSTNVLASKLRDEGIWIDVQHETFILLKILPPDNLMGAFDKEIKSNNESERAVDKLVWAEVPYGATPLPIFPAGHLSSDFKPLIGKYLHQIEYDNGRRTWSGFCADLLALVISLKL